jgi:HEAT repeat protein
MTPALTLDAMCARRGRAQVVAGCAALIRGDYADEPFIREIGGEGATPILDGNKRVDDRYWFRTWGARGLLYVWDDSALPAIVVATSDEHWRVREMAAKVVARHQLDDALPEVLQLREDPVPRVRAAANRAVARLTTPPG